jgi:hypothetical protein
MRDAVQERFKFTAGCEVILLKLDLGTISKPFLSVLFGVSRLNVCCLRAVNKREKYTH